MRAALLFGALALGGPAAAVEAERPSFDLGQRVLTSDEDFFRSETTLSARLTRGLRAGGAYSVFETQNRDRTECWTASAGKGWAQVSVGGGYSVMPRSEDFQARSSEVHAEVRTPRPDLQTSLFGAVRFVYHSQFKQRPAGHSDRFDMTQRIATARLAQRFASTSVGVEVAEYTYNRPLGDTVVGQFPRRDVWTWGELQGLLRGLPEHSVKVRVSQGLFDWPASLWASYQTFRMTGSGGLAGNTADSYRVGARATLRGRYQAGFDYHRFRQFPRREADVYGFELAARIGG